MVNLIATWKSCSKTEIVECGLMWISQSTNCLLILHPQSECGIRWRCTQKKSRRLCSFIIYNSWIIYECGSISITWSQGSMSHVWNNVKNSNQFVYNPLEATNSLRGSQSGLNYLPPDLWRGHSINKRKLLYVTNPSTQWEDS